MLPQEKELVLLQTFILIMKISNLNVGLIIQKTVLGHLLVFHLDSFAKYSVSPLNTIYNLPWKTNMTNLWHTKDTYLHAAFNRSGYMVQGSNKTHLFCFACRCKSSHDFYTFTKTNLITLLLTSKK